MKLISLYLITLLGAFGLGAAKYFGLGSLTSQSNSNPAWVAQLLGAVMTIGPVLIFPAVIPLGRKYARASLLGLSLLLSAGICLSGHWINTTNWAWAQLFSVGLCMGAYGMVRTSLVPSLASQVNQSLTFLNGCISVLFIVGILSGSIFGSYIFEYHLFGGWLGIATIFILPIPFTFFLRINPSKQNQASISLSTSLAHSLDLVQKHGLYLASSTSIWGVASAIILAVTLSLVSLDIASLTQATLMSVFAAVGGIVGNLLSARFDKRAEAFALIFNLMLALSLLLWAGIFSDPFLDRFSNRSIYFISSALMTLQGVFFGISTNLLDAKFLKLCHSKGKEIEAATLQSGCISLACFIIGSIGGFALLNNWITSIQQYILLSVITALASCFTVILTFQDQRIQTRLLNLGQFLVTRLLRLRYRWNKLEIPQVDNPKMGSLILPNHPAEMDPVLLENIFWKSHRPRPVMDESFYNLKGLHPIVKAIGAFPMPDLSKNPGTHGQVRVKQCLQDVAEALKNGENVLFYPSGQLKRQAEEKLASNSGLFKLLELAPEANLILVDNRGMWGSRFSTYPHHGQSPNLFQQLKTAFIDLCCNGIFFMPKRKLSVRCEKGSPELKKLSSAKELNRELEKWYRGEENEPLQLTKRWFWMPSNHTKNTIHKTETSENVTLTEEHHTLLQSISEYCEMPLESLHAATDLIDDLELDSLARMELFAFLEQEHQTTFPHPDKIYTISDLITMQQTQTTEETSSNSWPKQEQTPLRKIEIPNSNHIALAFLQQNDNISLETSIVADGGRGSLSSKKFRQCLYALTQAFKDDTSSIGICLPASSLAGASLLAAMLTQRLAVPLNWTVGPRAWKHALEVGGVKTIFTSRQFLSKVHLPIDQDQDIQWLVWEDILESLSLGEKWLIDQKSQQSSQQWSDEFNLNNFDAQRHAVLLFTSGSESLPKGVPLSHYNLLSNLRSSIDRMNLYCNDILMGFLPPFHAFGLTITTLLPLLTGIKVAYSANPTHTSALKRHIKTWRPNLICGTPTFFKNLLIASQPEDLRSINTYISGAEACPDSLKQELKQAGEHVMVLEGYGMTEAGPVLCLQNPEEHSEGVGAALIDIDLIIVDPNTYEKRPQGETGLILAKGPNFFEGYYQSDKNPWIEIEGEKWYNTGDLGKLNLAGDLILEGRLSRFVKVAGEMISLPALEKALYQSHHEDEEIELVVIPREIEGERPRLTLFSNRDLDLKSTNQLLRDAGFSALSKIHQCKKLDVIPTLGTGKTDFKELKNLLDKEVA